jgi:hypothetical protein
MKCKWENAEGMKLWYDVEFFYINKDGLLSGTVCVLYFLTDYFVVELACTQLDSVNMKIWLHSVEWFMQHITCVMLDLWYAIDTLMLVIMNYRSLLRIKGQSETLQISFAG